MSNLYKIVNDIFENSKKYKFIMIHSDITELLYNNDYEIVKEQFFNLFTKLTNDNKTVIIPTFNWDFCIGTEYHYLNTPSKVGILSKWCLESENFERTNDPLYSCAISGTNKNIFLDCEYTTAFGKDSIFDKINSLNSLVILYNNQHVSIIHYYEEKINVPYRYFKKFNGNVTFFKMDSSKEYSYEMFVRKLENNVNLNINQFGDKSFLNKYVGSIVNRIEYDHNNFIDFIPIKSFSHIIMKDLQENNNMLLKNCSYDDIDKKYSIEFTINEENLINFSHCSLDYNPNHISESFASKTMFNKRVVYGIYLFLLAINNIKTDKKLYFKNINCTFLKAALINDKINIKYDNNLIFITRNNEVITKIEFSIKENDSKTNIPINKYSVEESTDELREYDISDINDNYEDNIEIKYNDNYLNLCFDNLLNKFNNYQIIQILNFSRLVGMISPGKNALFLSFNINFDIKYLNNLDTLKYKLTNKNDNINLLTYSINGHNLNGEIMSFCKKNIKYKNVNEIDVNENSPFLNKNVLVIGGSNGIGEVTTKIMYKCKANVYSTYFSSNTKMEQIYLECDKKINTFQFNILNDNNNITKVEELKNLNIQHLFYFATPKIVINKNEFNLDRFNTYYQYYVDHFVNIVNLLSDSLEYVFYPSSIFLNDEQFRLDEYSIAKRLGEDIIKKLCLKYKNIHFYCERIPKLLTEQNNLYYSNSNDIQDPINYMIELLKLKKESNNIYLLSYKNIDFIKKELENNFKNKDYKILSCEYNQLEQDIINKESELYKNSPSFIFLINRIEDILKVELIDIYDENYDILFDNYISLIKNLSENINSPIYINSFHHTTIPITQNSITDISLDFLINKYNEKLYKLSDELSDINVINSNIFSNYNKIDFKSYFIGNYNYSYEYSKKIADFMYGLVMNKLGNSIRLIVVDLDNTLWGGVVGEDGVNGIKIGETYPGNCFTYFQKVLKSFTKIGISLALCSKNDENIVKQVFDERSEMILKYDDFISKKINWNNKSQNILNISKEVGLGLKNILFIDDNRIEREEVKQILPDINILEIDIDSPEDYAHLLLSNKKLVFNKISEEDLKRDLKYKKNVEFTNLKTNYSDIQEFYKSLQSKVYLNKLSDKNIDRCESLINKTNQFNFTTIRLNKNQIIEMNEKNYDFYVIGYENIFFEYENIGVIIFDYNKNFIFNYLLSCRVIGKGIEEDILIFLLNYLKSKNIENIKGQIIPTERNIPVREIYKKLDFTQIDDTIYTINLTKFNKILVNTEILINNNDILTSYKNNDKEIIKEKNKDESNKNNEDDIITIYNILGDITDIKPNIDDKIKDYQDWDSLKTILFISKIENKFKIKIKGNYFELTINDIIRNI